MTLSEADEGWQVGDIVQIHDQGVVVQVDFLDDDVTFRSERHHVDRKIYKEFEAACHAGQEEAQEFFKRWFGKETQIFDEDPEEEQINN